MNLTAIGTNDHEGITLKLPIGCICPESNVRPPYCFCVKYSNHFQVLTRKIFHTIGCFMSRIHSVRRTQFLP